VVVVDFCGGLAGVGPQYPSDVLDVAAFVCDGCGEEPRVERGAVEAFADVGAGGHHEQRRFSRLLIESAEGGGAGFGPDPTLQHDGIPAAFAQHGGEPLEVSGPLGEDEAVLRVARR